MMQLQLSIRQMVKTTQMITKRTHKTMWLTKTMISTQ